ncbi:MAG TPA: hypothetical protein VHZ29_14235 [Rhizomicrobium sp.]|jgi:plasmid stability protein|nr:hypothetical protein [Rhizomicrobium sp.]
MADLVINNLNRTAQQSLRDRAEKHGRSVADEAREIIENSLARFAPADNLYDAIEPMSHPLAGSNSSRSCVKSAASRPSATSMTSRTTANDHPRHKRHFGSDAAKSE